MPFKCKAPWKIQKEGTKLLLNNFCVQGDCIYLFLLLLNPSNNPMIHTEAQVQRKKIT